MADDESQGEDQPTSIEQDKAVAWRNEEFRRAKMASRGLQSKDFGSGGGEFIEPVQSGQPVSQLYPEDRQLLAMATGTQIVSGTPELASSYDPPRITPEYTADQIPSAQVQSFDLGQGSDIQEPDKQPPVAAVDPGLQDFDVPAPSVASQEPLVGPPSPKPFQSPQVAAKAVDSSAEAEVNRPSLATIAPPPEPVEQGLPEPRSLWPPGAGKQATAQQLETQKTLDTSGPQPKASSDRPNATRPPMFVDRGPPGMPEIDYGSLGDIFGDSPSATDTAHSEAMKAASDSIGVAGEMMLSVINQMTSMLVRIADGLSKVKDRLDAQDESDEW